VVALALLGVLVIIPILPLLAGFVIFSDSGEPKPGGHRVRLVIGFAIVAVGVSILFLPVSADINDESGRFGYRTDCGSALPAMFSELDQCGSAALPSLWVAGAVAAVGMGVAFWGEGRGRLLAAVAIPLLVAGFIGLVAFILRGGGGLHGGN
jgi:hypothetical protein